jgi:hypothetical protein
VFPDYKGVVHIAKPAEGLVGGKSSSLSLKSSMQKMVVTGDSGESMATPLICSQNWPLKLKYEVVRTWQESLKDIFFKMSS